MSIQLVLAVAFGGAIGSVARFLVGFGATKAFGLGFPWGTLIVNVAGGFAMGALAGWLALKAGEAWTQPVRLFVATGVLGGFTTFSAFSLEAVLLWERGQAAAAIAYVLASVALSILGLVLGLAMLRVMTS